MSVVDTVAQVLREVNSVLEQLASVVDESYLMSDVDAAFKNADEKASTTQKPAGAALRSVVEREVAESVAANYNAAQQLIDTFNEVASASGERVKAAVRAATATAATTKAVMAKTLPGELEDIILSLTVLTATRVYEFLEIAEAEDVAAKLSVLVSLFDKLISMLAKYRYGE